MCVSSDLEKTLTKISKLEHFLSKDLEYLVQINSCK